MKQTLALFAFILLGFSLSAKMLVKVYSTNTNLVGDGATMYYILSDSVCDKIALMHEPSQASVLNLWGLPVMDNQFAMRECKDIDTIKLDLEEAFSSSLSLTVRLKVRDYKIALTFTEVEKLEYCVSALIGRYWGSYPIQPKHAALLTQIPNAVRMSRRNKQLVKAICNSLLNKN